MSTARILCQVLMSSVKRDAEKMEKPQRRDSKMIKSLENMPSNSLTLVYQPHLEKCVDSVQGTSAGSRNMILEDSGLADKSMSRCNGRKLNLDKLRM